MNPPKNKDEEEKGSSDLIKFLQVHFSVHRPRQAFTGEQRYLNPLWVFYKPEVNESELPCTSFSDPRAESVVKEKIKTALTVLAFREPRIIIQFWSPITIGKHRLLTTFNQPFGVGTIDEAFYFYRMESERFMFVVDGEYEEKDVGPPGRVFQRGLPEWSFDIRNYLVKDYPRRDRAVCFNFWGSLNLPVFEPSSGCCVGVLELLMSSEYTDYSYEVQEVSRALKDVNLKSPQVFDYPTSSLGVERRQHELDNIFSALKMVCDTQKLPLAQTWSLSPFRSIVASDSKLEKSCSSFNKICLGKDCMSTSGLPFYVLDLAMWNFRKSCTEHHLVESQGVVGRAFSSHGSCFCGDITTLSEEEYPLVHIANISGLASFFAIYLHNVESNGDYVIEFFLPPHIKNTIDQHNLMETVNQNLKVLAGFELGKMSSIETIMKEFNIFQTSHTIGGVQLDLADGVAHDLLTYPDEKGESSKQSRKRKQSVEQITLEDIMQQFGKTMNDASCNLGISRSTLKRICRHHKIEKWPNAPRLTRKPGKDNDLLPKVRFGIYNAVCVIVGLARWKNRSLRKQTKESHHHSEGTLIPVPSNALLNMPFVASLVVSLKRWKNQSLRKKAKESFLDCQGKQFPVSESSNVYFGRFNFFNAASVVVMLTRWKRRSLEKGDLLIAWSKINKKTPQIPASPKQAVEGVPNTSPYIRGMGETTTTKMKASDVTIKASYGDELIKFSLSFSSTMKNLEEEVSERLELNLGTFRLKYEDEDSEWVSIICDKDMQCFMASSKSVGRTVIRMKVQLLPS